jgi:hypothetical protein
MHGAQATADINQINVKERHNVSKHIQQFGVKIVVGNGIEIEIPVNSFNFQLCTAS